MEAPFHKLQDLKELLLEKIHLRCSGRLHILMGQEFLVAKGGSSQGTRSCNVVGLGKHTLTSFLPFLEQYNRGSQSFITCCPLFRSFPNK